MLYYVCGRHAEPSANPMEEKMAKPAKLTKGRFFRKVSLAVIAASDKRPADVNEIKKALTNMDLPSTSVFVSGMRILLSIRGSEKYSASNALSAVGSAEMMWEAYEKQRKD